MDEVPRVGPYDGTGALISRWERLELFFRHVRLGEKSAICSEEEGSNRTRPCWSLVSYSLQSCEKWVSVGGKPLSLWYCVIAAKLRQRLTDILHQWVLLASGWAQRGGG